MTSLFTKIINKEISAHILAENEKFISFLDISPLCMGHALVVPKIEVDYIFDLDDKILQHLIVFAKKVSRAIEETIVCKRIGLAVVGLEVPHTHIHLIPLNSVNDINFSKPKMTPKSEDLDKLARQIRKNFI